MKQLYVLDESVAHCAATGQNERGQEDTSSLQLLQIIYDLCHGLAFTSELWGNWHRILSSLEGSSTSTVAKSVLRLLKLFATTQGKLRVINDPPGFDDESVVPDDDVYWIRLAIHTGAVAVTTDNRLIQELNEASVTLKHNLMLLRPERALARLL